MPEESTTPDLVELTRRRWDAVNRRDVPVAIRGFLEEWWGTFEELRFDLEKVLDLGNGTTFAIVRQDARPAGSTGYVQALEAYVYEWVDRMIARVTVYLDIDEARAAAERLAEERG